MRIQLVEKRALKRLHIKMFFADDSDGGNPLFPRALERIGIRPIRDDDGDLGANVPAFNRLHDGGEV